MSASQQLLLGGKQVAANYIEDVFSTYLYTGNGATQTINNGIDLAGKGGLVWTKVRSSSSAYTFYHSLIDTVRGAGNTLPSNDVLANRYNNNSLTAFNSNGYTLGADTTTALVNNTSSGTQQQVSWTFRKQPKFFDVVTYTGDGVAGRQIPHNLGSVPGCMIVKRLDTAWDWDVWHRALGASNNGDSYMELNTPSPENNGYGKFYWGNGTTYIPPTSTNFTVNTGSAVNASGATYVAYLFAHDAGGFGATGTDNVISCGSFTGSAEVNIGYEPQWLLVKSTSAAGDWYVVDNMRGLTVAGTTGDQILRPNTSAAESTFNSFGITATGFSVDLTSGDYIYIAIRRGPMKVPTDGTKVFKPNYSFAPSPPSWHSDNFPVDMAFWKNLSNGTGNYNWGDRLRGKVSLSSNLTDAEVSNAQATFDYQEGWYLGSSYGTNYASWMFQRAPGFFDVVCYTGDGVAGRAITHNLGVTPEWMIIKRRTTNDGAGYWASYSATTGNTQSTQFGTVAAALTNSTFWNNTSPTSTNFTVGTITRVNGSAETYVAYLFASCPGVSKVGSYTGNGTTQTINCGFAAGARFVLIKRTDTTGDWYTYDTARGMTTTTDPYLLLNSTAAESASLGSVTTVTTGFALNAGILAAINATGGSYIFLAIS